MASTAGCWGGRWGRWLRGCFIPASGCCWAFFPPPAPWLKPRGGCAAWCRAVATAGRQRARWESAMSTPTRASAGSPTGRVFRSPRPRLIRIDAVEEFIALAAEAGLSLTHMALAFVITHPGVSAALIGPRTMEQLDDLRTAAQVPLSDDLLDRIDAIVAPGTGVGRVDQEY